MPAGASAVAGSGVEGDGAKARTAASEGGGSVTTGSLAASVARREQLQRERQAACVYYQSTLNHQNSTVSELLREKLIDAEQPPRFSCPACERAKVQRDSFNSKKRVEDGPRLAPFAIAENDLYGPIDVGDPNGFRFLIVFICTTAGATFGQSLRAKSEAVKALRAFANRFRLRAKGIAVKL